MVNIRVYEKTRRNVKYTEEFKKFKKYSNLFWETETINDAPRGGKLGEIKRLSKKDINKIKKKLLFAEE